MSDRHEAIYTQNAESYRHQNALKWSRVRTAALIEGAILYGVYSTKIPDNVKIAILICGSCLILVVELLIRLDRAYAHLHLDVMKRYEEDQGLKCGPAPMPGWGTRLLRFGLFVIIGFNVYMFIVLLTDP